MYWTALVVLAIILTSWGYIGQIKKIQQLKSGQSVSVLWMISALASSLGVLIYGAAQQDKLFTLNAFVCSFLQICILVVLFKYKGLKQWERVVCTVYAALLIWTIVTPHKDVAILYNMVMNAFCTLTQPAEIGFEKKVGALDISMLVKFCISAFALATYSWSHGYKSPILAYAGFGVFMLFQICQWLFVRFWARSS